MTKLSDIGFLKDTIYETILSTYNQDGTPNAAPMGVTMQNPQTLSLNIFNSTQTSRNLKANKCAVINLTENIEIFYKTAFQEANPDGKLPLEWFEKSEVNAPRLRLAEATINVLVIGEERVGTEKTRFLCKIEQINATKIFPKVYCRAMSATLEAIIHATRVKVFVKDNNKNAEVNRLVGLIENCSDVVTRTAPNSGYSEVMADLTKRIEGWRNKP